MRILFCNFEYPPLGGGGGVANALLAEELAKRHKVTVFTSRALGLPAESVENGVRIVRVRVLFRRQRAAANLLSMFEFMTMGILSGRRHLMRDRYDVLNTHFALPSGPVGDALARFSHTPNVLSVHGGDLYDPSKWTSPHRHRILRAWIRHLLQRADHVVAQSRNTLDNARRYYLPDVEAERIPLGIKRPLRGAATRGDFGFSDSDALLITVGRLVARKAVDQLIDAMARLRDLNAHLLILGSGPMELRLRARAGKLGVADRIRFLGFVAEAEKFRLLRMCDLFVSTSQHEGFGLVFLEAMACGLPIVCYSHGGQTDFLEDGVTGGLVPLNDRDGFLDRCRRLVAERTRRAEAAEMNLRRVEAYFIDQCASRYEAVFERVLARTGRNQ